MLKLPNGRKVIVLDVVVAVWAIAWVAVGVLVAETVGELTGLTGAFRSVGGAVTGVGQTLGNVDVPLLGDPLDRASVAVADAGRDVSARGESVRVEIEHAAMLLGAVVAAIPILTLVLPYAPARAARANEAAALRRLLGAQRDPGDPGLEHLLATRALIWTSYGRLARIARRPWELEEPATRRALAEEELRRLGVGVRRLGAPRGAGDGEPEREPPP